MKNIIEGGDVKFSLCYKLDDAGGSVPDEECCASKCGEV